MGGSTSVNASAGSPSQAPVEPTLPLAPAPAVGPEREGFPSHVGRYVVQEVLGAGAMGVVLRAVDPELHREVAIKVLHAKRSSEAGTTRLLREAQALARLSHPNVVDVYDVGMVDGRVFIAMEYVRGPNLHEWLRERPSQREIVDAFVQAARGLAAAHAAGIVHRDFKPANALRGPDGRVRVADFGLAAPVRGDEAPTSPSGEGHLFDMRVTATGVAVGTPAYMSPEAHDGGAIDAKSDQWSLCVSLYEALHGQRPFSGPDVPSLARAVRRGPPRPPASGDVPRHVSAAVLRGLSVDPDARWPSMEALIEQLRPRRRRWPWIVGTIGAAAGVVVLAMEPASDDACERAEAAVADVWGASSRVAVEQAFLRTGSPLARHAWQGVGERLDAHALALAGARRAACEASRAGHEASERLDRRVTCLGRRVADLRGLVTELRQADEATVRNAMQIVGDLRSPDECDGDVAESAVPPAIAAQAERAFDDMARVRTSMRAGHYEHARGLAEQVLVAVTALEHPPLLAEARLLHGKALVADGHYERAEAELEAARSVAQAAGNEAIVAEASTTLAFLVGAHLRRPDDAERWARHARAAIDRMPERGEAGADLDGTLGNLRQAAGDFSAARAHFERALASVEGRLGSRHPEALTLRSNIALTHHHQGDNYRARELLSSVLVDRVDVYGPVHPEVSAVLGNLGVVEQALGQLAASAEHTQQALDGLEASVGQDHPLYPQLLTNLANTHYLMGHLDEALRMHERAKDLLEQSLGLRAFPVGRSLINIGAIHHRAQRHQEARRAYQAAREILEEHLQPNHPELAVLLTNLAHVDRDTGRLDDALSGFDRALAMLEKALGAASPELAFPLAGRGHVHLSAGRPAQALDDLRRAVGLLESAALDPEALARARYSLATAQWAIGARVEATRTMAQARVEAERLGETGRSLAADAQRWIVEHDDER